MSIKDFKKQMKKASNSGTTIKLNDGEKVVGCFVGDYVTYYSLFNKETNSGKQYTKEVPGSKLRFKWNFVIKENDKYIMKVWDGSATVGETLADCIEKYGQETWFEISRKGIQLETRYNIMFEAKLEDKDKKEIEKLQQFDLGKYIKDPYDLSNANEVPLKDTPPHSDDDAPEEVPF